MDEDYLYARDRAWARLALALSAFSTGIDFDPSARPRDCATRHCRRVAMYICHVGFGMSLTRIAHVFHRDRSTVSLAMHSMEDRRDDPGFDALCDALEATARAAPAPTLRLSGMSS